MAPEIALVPGMCSVGSVVFRDLVKQLKTTLPEATTHVIDLPSVDGIATNANLEPNGLEADIRAIQATLRPLVEGGKSVVVVAHSYGGTPALAASEGLWKSQRPNNTGGVIKAALISSSLALPDGSVAGDRETWKQENGQIEDPPNAEMKQHGKEMFLVPTGFEHAWMNDLQDPEIRASLRPSPLSTVMTPAPQTDVKNWDIAYLATTELDLAMPEAFQKHLADRARAAGARVDYDTIKSGHFVQISHVDEVAQWIARWA